MKRMGIAIFAALFFTLVSSPAGAGLYWDSTVVTKKIPGKKDGTQKSKNYVTEYATRTENGDVINIFDCETLTMYRLNAKEKTYSKANFSTTGMPAGQQEMMQKMLGEMTVEKTDQKKTINGHECVKHVVTLMMNSTDYWVAGDMDAFTELKMIGENMSKVFEKNPMLRQINLAGMVGKLNGFPLMIEANIMGGTMTQTIKNVEKRKYEKDFFKVPKDYKLVEGKKKRKTDSKP